MKFRVTLPCGTTIAIVRLPPDALTHPSEFLWSVELPEAGCVFASGYTPDYVGALVQLRWAATSCLTRSIDTVSRAIEADMSAARAAQAAV